MFRKLLDQGEAGDNVGVLLRGTKREEVINFNDSEISPKAISVSNITTDITPCENISGFITESGIIYPPFNNTY